MRNVLRFRDAGAISRRTLRDSAGLSLALCLLIALGLCSCFAMTVLSRPARTPLLTLGAVYGPQWDLNGWVWEDLQQIGGLGEGTFQVKSLPAINSLSDEFWDDADEMFSAALRSGPAGGPVVIYVNLHGAMDDRGRACWIPSNATVNDASTWFPIEELLDHLHQAQPSNHLRPIVLILECGKLRSHWPAGIADNDFESGLEKLVNQHRQKYPQASLTILSSADRGQISLASQLGDGDVFTRFVAEALAGAADGAVPGQATDGYIDTTELHRYVRHRTNVWAKHHRGVSQTPTMHRSIIDDVVHIGRVGRQKTGPPISRTPPPSPAQLKRLHGALQSVAAVRHRQPIATDGYLWSQIQRTMHAIEQSVFAGMAARRSNDRLYNRLDRMLRHLNRKIDSRESEMSQLADMRMNRSAAAIWSALEKQPTRTTAMELLRALDRNEPMPVPMLHEIAKHPDSSFWAHPDSIRKTAGAQQRWLQCAREIPDRLFPAAQQIIASIHRSRRYLADTILAEDTDDRSLSRDQIVTAVNDFDDNVATSCQWLVQLTGASQTRDRALLKLPYLYQWIDHLAVTVEQPEYDLQAGLDDVIQLDRLLNRFATQSVPWSQTFHDQIVVASQRSADYVDELCGFHDDALHQFNHSDSNDPGDIAGCLSTAIQCRLLASDPRHHLQAQHRLRQIDASLVGARIQPSGSQEESADQVAAITAATGSKYLSQLLDLPNRRFDPAVARQRLRQASTGPTDQSQQVNWRRMISLVADDGFASVIDDAKKRAQRYRLASTAIEVLDDFWHSPPTGGVPYFAATAQQLIEHADSLADDSPRWRTSKRELTAKLQSHRKAATDGVVIEALSRPSYADIHIQRVSVAIETPPDHGSLPDGTAAVEIQQQPSDDVLTHQVVAIGANQPRRHTFETTLAARRDAPAVAEVKFRGNAFRSTVVASDTSYGATSMANLAPPGAKITVHDGADRRQAICFVVDCSASMNDAAEPEVARDGTTSASATKLDAARGALLEMLHRLKSGTTEIGLVLYGHRMALGTGDEGLLLQKRYHQPFPFPSTLKPFEDVEIALPTGRFSDVELSIARQRLDATVPWGQTPLFLAISGAIDDLSRLGSSISKDVIVISDGKNYQFNPSPQASIELPALIAKAKQHRVRVHIIGFGLEKENAAEATAEFTAVAKGSGGQTCSDVYRATELAGQLRRFTPPQTFSVTLDDQTITAKLGETIEIATVPRDNAPLSVTIGNESTAAPISPGSHLRLLTRPSQGSLRSVPYNTGLPQFTPLVDHFGRPAASEFAAHHPHKIDEDLHCKFSIQYPSGRIAERPAMVWVEVHALDSNSKKAAADLSASVYRTPVATWLDDTTCPVAEFVCRRWPQRCEQYSVQAWCRPNPPEGNVVTVAAGQQDYQPLKDKPGVSYRIVRTENEVQLRLRYDNPIKTKSNVDDCMLIVQMPAWNKGQATHWYDAVRRKSVHSFVRPTNAQTDSAGAKQSEPGEGLTFWICSIADMKKGSLRTKETIQSGLHPTMTRASATMYR